LLPKKKRGNKKNMNIKIFKMFGMNISTWVKSMVGLSGKMHQLKCKVCAKIDEEEKSLAPKLDSLWKHG
jgi:hypothetical protein